LNIDKLTLWAKENRDLEFKMHLKNNPNMTIEQLEESHSAELSFFDSYFLLTGKKGEKSKWNADFDKEFPEIVEFINRMPILGEPHFGFVRQKPFNSIENFNPHRVSHIHVDELGSYGIRMYIGSTKNRMSFYGLREGTLPEYIETCTSTASLDRYHKLDDNGRPVFYKDVPLSNDAFFDTPVRTKLKTENQVFFINGVKASHFVSHEENENKLTFLIMGRRDIKNRYDWQKIADSIEESKIHREDEFIYYNDLRN